MGKADQIISDALALPDEERAQVAHRLLDSIEAMDPHADLTDEDLARELVSRARDAADGNTRGASWKDAKHRIVEKLTTK